MTFVARNFSTSRCNLNKNCFKKSKKEVLFFNKIDSIYWKTAQILLHPTHRKKWSPYRRQFTTIFKHECFPPQESLRRRTAPLSLAAVHRSTWPMAPTGTSWTSPTSTSSSASTTLPAWTSGWWVYYFSESFIYCIRSQWSHWPKCWEVEIGNT